MQLIDSNILIYSGEAHYAPLLLPFVTDTANLVSVISKVETLGFVRITPPQILYFESLFTILQAIPVDDAVIQKAIELRQIKKMSLGDSLVAATTRPRLSAGAGRRCCNCRTKSFFISIRGGRCCWGGEGGVSGWEGFEKIGRMPSGMSPGEPNMSYPEFSVVTYI